MTTTQFTPKETSVKKVHGDGYSVEPAGNQDDFKSIKDGGANLARHLKEDAIDIAHSISAESKNTISNLRSSTQGYIKVLEKEIILKPVQSVAIAFAVGSLLSLMLGRR